VTLRLLSPLAVFPFLAAGCTFLAQFDDRADELEDEGGTPADNDGGSIVPGTDGGTPAPPRDGAANDLGTTTTDSPAPVDTGPPIPCQGQPDGKYGGITCCGGQQTALSTNENCGVCGLACRTDLGHACIFIVDHFACAGCLVDGGGGNASCWTGCCSSVGTPLGTCAPEALLPGCGIGVCNDDACHQKAPGSGCTAEPFIGAWCEY
jgi:hypothetical protein